MQISILRPVQLDVDAIRFTVPIRHDDDLIALAGKPGVTGRVISLVLDLEKRVVRDWPTGQTLDLHLKVVDQGLYELLSGGEVVAKKDDCYVPRCLPQEYGDYIVMHVEPDGSIRGWNPHPGDIADCFDEAIDE